MGSVFGVLADQEWFPGFWHQQALTQTQHFKSKQTGGFPKPFPISPQKGPYCVPDPFGNVPCMNRLGWTSPRWPMETPFETPRVYWPSTLEQQLILWIIGSAFLLYRCGDAFFLERSQKIAIASRFFVASKIARAFWGGGEGQFWCPKNRCDFSPASENRNRNRRENRNTWCTEALPLRNKQII